LCGESNSFPIHDVAHLADVQSHSGRLEYREKPTDDFVYTVALTSDLKYLAYGGTAKRVHVCDGLSGRELFKVSTPGTVWTVALLEQPPRLVYGGECAAIALVDLETGRDELQLPVNETIYSATITSDSICFVDGNKASMYGKAGIQYSWQDQPSCAYVPPEQYLWLTQLNRNRMLVNGSRDLAL
jgi:WD40 repeat protein